MQNAQDFDVDADAIDQDVGRARDREFSSARNNAFMAYALKVGDQEITSLIRSRTRFAPSGLFSAM
jgi:hypothetical protein